MEENASAINLHVQHLFILTFIFARICSCSSTKHMNLLLFFRRLCLPRFLLVTNDIFFLFSYCKGMSVAIYPFFFFCESSSLQRM